MCVCLSVSIYPDDNLDSIYGDPQKTKTIDIKPRPRPARAAHWLVTMSSHSTCVACEAAT